MHTPENSLKIHNFYLIGKEIYDLGICPDKIERKDLLLPRFNFGETIQEVGLEIKLEYNNFKYYEENETIVSFEQFHFKDFDAGDLNIWLYFELLFHQWFLYGVTFNTNKIEIYDRLRKYLVSIYGDYRVIPDQDSSSLIVAWFFEKPTTSIYLEIEQKGNGEKFIVLTYYDELLKMSINKNYNIYPLVRSEAYRKDMSKIINQTNKGFFSKLFNQNIPQNNKDKFDFSMIKSQCENLLTNENSKPVLKEVSNYILAKIIPNQLNLEIGDWLINIAVKIHENQLFDESEQIYNLFINWLNAPSFIPSKERIELIASAHKNLINVFGDNNRNDEAINSFTNCIKLLDDNLSYVNSYNYAFIAGQANFNIANVYSKIGKKEYAIKHSYKGLDYFEPCVSPWTNNNTITTIILAINNLGNYLSDNGDYDEAAVKYTMGMRFALDNKRYYDSTVINMNLALTLVKQNNYNEAEKQYNVLLDFIKNEPEIFKDNLLEGWVLVNMADMFKATNNKDKELEFLVEAVSYYESVLFQHPEIEKILNNLKKRKVEHHNY